MKLEDAYGETFEISDDYEDLEDEEESFCHICGRKKYGGMGVICRCEVNKFRNNY